MAISRLKTSTITNGIAKTQSLWNKESYDGIVKSGLLVHLDATVSASYPGSGNTWFDISGNSNNFTIQNSVPYTSGASGYFEFTRTSNHHMTNTTFANYNWTNGFTVGVWHRNPSSPDLTYYRGLITNGLAGVDRTGSWEMRYGRENFYGGTQNGTALSVYVATPTGSNAAEINGSLGAWAYYVLVYNNTHVTAYKNGYSFNSRDVAGGIAKTMTSGVTIGLSPGTSESIDGRISHVHIYNRPLSKNEVLSNFNTLKGRHGL